MKKTILAVAIPAFFASSVSAVEIFSGEEGSVDFYGQMRTELKKAPDNDVTLGAGSSRAGVTAKYNVSDALYVHGKYEFGLSDNEKNGGDLYGRQHFAGFGGDFGKVSFGQQWTLQDDIYGADWSYFYGGGVILYTPVSGGQHSSLVKYNYDADNYSINLSYGFAEDDRNAELMEAFATFNAGDFDFILGAVAEDQGTEAGATPIDFTAYTFSAGYTLGDVYLQGTYYGSTTDSMGVEFDTTAYALASTYSWSEQGSAYAGVEMVEVDGAEDLTIIYVGSDYNLNAWSRLYAEIGYEDQTDSDTSFGIGYRVYW